MRTSTQSPCRTSRTLCLPVVAVAGQAGIRPFERVEVLLGDVGDGRQADARTLLEGRPDSPPRMGPTTDQSESQHFIPFEALQEEMNAQHPTSNNERRRKAETLSLSPLCFDVRCWALDVRCFGKAYSTSFAAARIFWISSVTCFAFQDGCVPTATVRRRMSRDGAHMSFVYRVRHPRFSFRLYGFRAG